jgi:imidazolonepropionase-like amidohydrolase
MYCRRSHPRGIVRRPLAAGLVVLGSLSTFTAIIHAQAPAARPAVPGAPAGMTAFVDVAVIPMDTERVLPNQTVLVEGGRVTALGPAKQVKVPAGATRIDGQGKYLIPGLGDCHTHIGYGKTSKDKLADTVATVAAAERRLFTWFADGVTTIRNMDYLEADQAATIGLYKWYLNGRDLLRLRGRAVAGELWSPRIYTSGQWVPMRHTPEYARYVAKNQSAEAPVPSLDSVTAYLAAYKAAGYDHVKVHTESEEMFDSLLVAAQKVGIALGADLGGHRNLAGNSFLEKALAGKVRSIEHFSRYPNPATISQAEMQKFVTATVRAGTWSCPTLEAAWGQNSQYVRPLQDAGAGILLGTDAPIAPSVHAELKALVSYGGLTPYEALAAGTRNMAAFFNTLDDVGTIAVGKRADLVLLDGNPLEDIGNAQRPAVVMIGGRWLAREELDRRLAANKAAATAANP